MPYYYHIEEVFGQEQEREKDEIITLLQQKQDSNSCITYDPENKVIVITCRHATLTDIDNQLKDPDILHRETIDGIWLLNASIVIDKQATLTIDSRDTKWLKIVAGGDANKEGPKGDKTPAYYISVLGSLVIDSVKITSWIPSINDYMKYEVELRQGSTLQKTTPYDRDPRPYIKIERDAQGYTSITNSEIAYLGYDCGGGCSGLSYYGGLGGHTLKNNEIHHNRFGYYSSGVSNTTIEDNHVHHNFMYGFDPHTGTHDMTIRNNTVHDHGAMGIICSLDCYNIIIENNEVYRSTGSGIMFSKNMTDSVARNNYVHDESKCIFISQSHRNEIYNNLASDCNSGVRLFHDSSENIVYNNTIANSKSGLNIEDIGPDNQIYSNTIVNATEKAIDIEEDSMNAINNISENNEIISFESIGEEEVKE
jgi:parallel beta-helix repeat protein